jgi:segregation and condensation protein B
MSFNLKKVLKALLYSSSQPLAVRDIQALFERFHRQVAAPAAPEPAAGGGRPAEAPPAEAADVPEEPAGAPDLYEGVPTFVSAAQIRETMDAIATELAASDDGLVLVDGAAGYRLATEPRFARWVRILREEPPR